MNTLERSDPCHGNEPAYPLAIANGAVEGAGPLRTPENGKEEIDDDVS